MTVVGLHPEELFDKLGQGELSQPERERLRQHLEGCDVCRFEYAARLDFEREAQSLGASPPPLMPLRSPRAVAAPPRRRRRRRLMWGLAAAALITASGALASVVAGKPVWRGFSVLVSRPAPPPRLEQPGPSKPLVVERAEPAAPAPATVAAATIESPSLDASARPSSPKVVAAAKAPPAAGEVAPVARASQASPSKEPASQASPSKEPASQEAASNAPLTAAKLFAEANQARRAGDFGRAAGLYQLLQEQYPGSAEAELSRVTLALLQLDSGDARGALKGFERYLAGPSRGLEAEALVGRARALGRLGRRDLEVAAWQEVQRKYPRSIYGRQAAERLLALGRP